VVKTNSKSRYLSQRNEDIWSFADSIETEIFCRRSQINAQGWGLLFIALLLLFSRLFWDAFDLLRGFVRFVLLVNIFSTLKKA
jgi:hypothetical protein